MTILYLAAATSAISLTCTTSVLFRDVRNWIIRKTWNHARNEKGKLGELCSCYYCFSHWVAFVLAVIYRPRFVASGVPIIDILLSAFAVIWVAAFMSNSVRTLGTLADMKTWIVETQGTKSTSQRVAA